MCMTHRTSSLRPAAAAIAAVLAFPATALAAPAPVIDIAPIAQPAPAPAPAIVIAPAPAPPPLAEATQLPAAPPPVTAREAARPVTGERAAERAVARTRPANAAEAASDSPAARAIAAPAGVPAEAAADTALTPPAVLPEPPVAEAAPVDASDDAAGETITYALLGAGAAVLGLGGIAIAVRRRRRIADRNVDTVPVVDRREAPAREPAMARPIPSGAPAPFAYVAPRQQERTVTAPRTGMGRHEAMVDYGPTADNPFLTRRNRLRRARYLDRMDAGGWLGPHSERRLAAAR